MAIWMGKNPARPARLAQEERQHRRIAELLSWYANGTLAAAERQAVEAHAGSCPRCQDELAASAELARAIQGAGETAPSPHPVQLSRLFARIDAHQDTRRTAAAVSEAPLKERLAARFDLTPRRMGRLLAAELAAILALASILGWHLRTPAARPAPASPTPYRTYSTDAPVAVAPGTAPLRILFAEGTTAVRIQHLLTDIHGQITAGPSPIGAYVVAVPAGPGADSVDLVLVHLRSQPEVSFAERVAGAGGT
jgi:hypothetical protein